MKKFTYILSAIITLSVICYVVFCGIYDFDTNTVKVKLDDKKLNSSDFLEYVNNKVIEDKETIEEKEDSIEEKEVVLDKEIEKEEVEQEEEKEEVVVSKPVSDVLEKQVGSLSGYGPDCKGCSGYLASGRYVGDGNIYYSDSTYGTVRILSGDKTYPFGTIVRVKSSSWGTFLAIVLDRGGGVGFGKTHLFDLLYQSNSLAYDYGVSYNTVFEILRYGY